MNITTVGIDLAKTSFSLVGMDKHGKVVLRKTVTRSRLLPFIAQLPPCLIGMEACSGAHHWGREFRELGHQVSLIAVKFVEPYRKGSKNDNNDAEAICEAARRPNLHFVPIKTVDQQALLCVHRVRQALVWDRTRLLNQLRGLLSEFGIVMAKGRYPAQHVIPTILEDAGNGLPMIARRTIEQLVCRIADYSGMVGSLRPGWAWFPGNTPPATRSGWGGLQKGGISIYEPAWCMVPGRW